MNACIRCDQGVKNLGVKFFFEKRKPPDVTVAVLQIYFIFAVLFHLQTSEWQCTIDNTILNDKFFSLTKFSMAMQFFSFCRVQLYWQSYEWHATWHAVLFLSQTSEWQCTIGNAILNDKSFSLTNSEWQSNSFSFAKS